MILKCISNKTANENLVIGNLYKCFSDHMDNKVIWVVDPNIKEFKTFMAYKEDFIDKKDWREIQLDKLF
jgi:hypothetical protein